MIRTIFTATAAMALLAAGQAAALQKNPDGTTAEEKANTAKLNADQLAKAQAETDAYNARVAANAQQEATAQSTFLEETSAYEAEKARHEITKADLGETLDMLHEALDVARTIAEGARAVNLENRLMIDELSRILKG